MLTETRLLQLTGTKQFDHLNCLGQCLSYLYLKYCCSHALFLEPQFPQIMELEAN